jgi:hypothetical protein
LKTSLRNTRKGLQSQMILAPQAGMSVAIAHRVMQWQPSIRITDFLNIYCLALDKRNKTI